MTSALVFFGTFLVIGVLAYYCDAVKGVDWYRAWYRLTHKEPLPPEMSRGFIVGQKGSDRIWTAIPLALVASGLLFLFGERSLITLFWLTVVESVALFFGFFLAGLVHIKWNPEAKTAGILKTLDDIESGAIDPTQKARDAYESTKSTVTEKARGVFADIRAARSEGPAAGVPETDTPKAADPSATGDEHETEVPGAIPKRNFDDALRKFQGRG